MKIMSNKIIIDIKQLLENYLNESNTRDLMKSLDEDISMRMDIADKLSSSDKAQIEYEPLQGKNYRLVVDKAILRFMRICPSFITSRMFLFGASTIISRSGFPSTRMRSAHFPCSRVPI